MFLLVEERFICAYHEVIVNVIELATLSLPCSMRWNKSLKNKEQEQSRELLAKVHSRSWNIKVKLFNIALII